MGAKMREEIRQELQRKIAEKFKQAMGEMPKVTVVSEEQRRARTARYAEMLIKAALAKT
jgi:hypothetical protein